MSVRSSSQQPPADKIFQWQYAHAQGDVSCCSLLRNGDRSGSMRAPDPRVTPPPLRAIALLLNQSTVGDTCCAPSVALSAGGRSGRLTGRCLEHAESFRTRACGRRRLTCEGQLRLVHPDERQLIGQLLATVDGLCCPDRPPQVRTFDVSGERLVPGRSLGTRTTPETSLSN
ncbi:MAG: hypothetical protein GDA48_25635 [Hormoscilla sp. GM102CHS1]|nr:hypothetical protein [Hormoscilla sp. GM102CHS1]